MHRYQLKHGDASRFISAAEYSLACRARRERCRRLNASQCHRRERGGHDLVPGYDPRWPLGTDRSLRTGQTCRARGSLDAGQTRRPLHTLRTSEAGITFWACSSGGARRTLWSRGARITFGADCPGIPLGARRADITLRTGGTRRTRDALPRCSDVRVEPSPIVL